MTKLPTYIQQPGPDGPASSIAHTRTVEMDFIVPAGVSLADSLAAKIQAQGLTGAYLHIINADMQKLHYVIPGLSPDDDHVAWYSRTYIPDMPGKIIDAGITCGRYDDAPFYHCHGHLSDAHGSEFVGHLLPETCIPRHPVQVRGFGFLDAGFARVQDTQTGFELFVPEQINAVPKGGDILLRITPNTEISAPLIECCQGAGWDRAQVHGIGSTIGAHFANGDVLDSFATELLITSGTVDLTQAAPVCDLDIILVGLGGSFKQGRLKAENNPVLITAEILLRTPNRD